MSDAVARRPLAAGRNKIDVMMFGLRSVGAGQGGVEAHVDNLVQELDRLGLSVLVVTRSSYTKQRSTRGRATRFVPLWAPRSQNWEAVVHSLLATCYAIVHRPRIVHVHAIGPSLVVPILRLAGLKVVTTHHGEDYNREKWGRAAAAALRLGEFCQGRFANARICVSRSLARRLEGRFSRPFAYLPNGVKKVQKVLQIDELVRHGLEPGRYILTVSRLVPEKRHFDLIAAFEGLQRPNLHLVIVGAADHESDYSDALEQRAREVPNVIMTGFLTGAPLQQMLAHAGVFVLPSSHEGLPIALLEAMAHGRNVVVSDIAPNLDVGLPEECYHKAGDIEDLRAKLERAISSPAMTAGRDWSSILVAFDWTDIARRTLDIYMSVSPYISLAV
jgi:glycosyltransferase involved in cell wall biosynthesis